MIVVLVAIFYFDNHFDDAHGGILFAAIAILIALGGRELTRLFNAKLPAPSPHPTSSPATPPPPQISYPLLTLAAIGTCAVIYARPWLAELTLPILITWLVLTTLAAFIRHSVPAQRTDQAITVGALTALGIIYMGIGPAMLLIIRQENHNGAYLVAAIIMATKCCDIGAYFTGRAIGKHKLIPWLSPGKTWQGLIGGMILSAIVAASLAQLDCARYPIIWAAASGALLGLFGQVGDLLASLFKRDAGVKDSGNTIPGFGGVLDVVDSPIIAAPIAWLLLQLLH